MKRLFLALSAFAILSLFASCVSTEAQAVEETELVEEADATSAATDATSGATGEASGEY
jgi:hypothetical protein